MKKQDIGDRLRALRILNDLTTKELANRISYSQSYISQFENNHATPDFDILQSILNVLGTDLSTFFSSEFEDMPVDLIQLITTVKTLSPEARIKLNAFLKAVM